MPNNSANPASYVGGTGNDDEQKAIAVQVTRYVGRYIRDYVGADQYIYKDAANHPAVPEKWVGTAAVDKELRRLKNDLVPSKCKILKKDNTVVLKFIKDDGDSFYISCSDVVRCRGRVFGRVKRIDERLGAGARPNPSLHLHLLRHERDGMLQGHAHPKRLFELEDCRDVAFSDVVEKIEIVPGHVRPGFHLDLRAENEYICSHRITTATNSLIAIPPHSHIAGCPGCLFKSDKDKKKKRVTVDDFVVYRLPGTDLARDPCDIGLVKRVSETSLVVLPLSRWDAFVKQDGVRESGLFRTDEKLWYLNTKSSPVKISLEDVLAQVKFIGLSKVTQLGQALRPGSTLSDFWTGKRFIDETEDIYVLIDGPFSLDYLYQSEEKRRQYAGRSDFLNNMRRDVPLGDVDSLIRLCVNQHETTVRIGAQTGIIDCCAGIGGFSMGVVDTTKASIPLAIENDADIVEQYGKLHPTSIVVDKGVAFAAKNWEVLKVRAKMNRFRYVILQAGVPCQPFSRLNRHQKVDDPRLGVIFEVLGLLQVSGASHLLIECVDGMLYHRNGTASAQAEILCIALRALLDLGYQFSVNVHQAAAYGTPQSRRRVFIWATKIGLPLPAPPRPTHYAGSTGIARLCRYELQPVPAQGPMFYVTQQDAISDLPDILGASTSAFDGGYRAQFYGYQHGDKSYKGGPMNNYQSMMRGYKDTPRVGLQYCHVPTESAYGKLLADSEKEGRHRLPEAFPCVTTGSLIAHPTQQRTFTPRERLRAQGIPDFVQLRWKELDSAELIKEYEFLCLLAGNAVPVPLAKAHGRAFVKSLS